MTVNISVSEIRILKLRAAVEVLGAFGLLAVFALMMWAPELVFGGDPVGMRPIEVASSCARLP